MRNSTIIVFILILVSFNSIAQEKATANANEVAKFLAGKPSIKYAKLQKKSWYKTHKKDINWGWNQYTKKTLEQIKTWNTTTGLPTKSYSGTLFYPFSGPDFLYANAFFPNAKNYIMQGLEAPGKLPDFNKIPENTVKNYLIKLRKSLSYINKSGYFVTTQMLDEFSDLQLNGTIHVMLYYLAKNNFEVIETQKIYITKKGKAKVYSKYPGNSFLKGVKYTFKKVGEEQIKTAYYLRVNAENQALRYHPEFLKFVASFGKSTTYLKSASYLMHNKEFITIRNFVLKNSNDILQDDTGLDYSDLNKKFDIRLFGEYTKTIKVFNYRFQKDLQLALSKEKRNKDLPFHIGYNRWHDEAILMYAVANPNKKTESVETIAKTTTVPIIKKNEAENNSTEVLKGIENKDVVTFKVQITMSNVPITNKKYFSKLGYQPDVYKEKGNYKYTIGNETTYAACKQYKSAAKALGFDDAFTVAFYKGQRIDVIKAIKLQKNDH